MALVFANHDLILLTPIVRLLGAFLDTSFKDWRLSLSKIGAASWPDICYLFPRGLYFGAGVMAGWSVDVVSESARCRNIAARSASRRALALAPAPEASEAMDTASNVPSAPS